MRRRAYALPRSCTPMYTPVGKAAPSLNCSQLRRFTFQTSLIKVKGIIPLWIFKAKP